MKFGINIILLLFVFSLISCSKRISYIGEKNNSILVSGLTPFAISISSDNLKMSSMTFRSKVYSCGRDTFMITIIDKNDDKLFNSEEDIVAISSFEDIYVPVLPEVNPNISRYKTELIISFNEKVYSIDSISEKGYIQNLQYLGIEKKVENPIDARYSDFIDLTLKLELLGTGEKITMSHLLEETTHEYIYFNFWSTFCAQCFEDIPILVKLMERGNVKVVNVSYWKESSEQIEKTIKRFEYPGEHYKGSIQIVKSLAQNGFPFGVLINVDNGGEIMLESNFKEDVLDFFSIE